MSRDENGRVSITLPAAALSAMLAAVLGIGGARIVPFAAAADAPKSEEKVAALDTMVARIDERQRAYEREISEIRRLIEAIDRKVEQRLPRPR